MLRQVSRSRRWRRLAACCAWVVAAAPAAVQAQATSVSAWEAADFRSWSFIPNWTSQSQVNSFATDRVYDHLSDVLYSFGVQPKADGSLYYHPSSNGHLPALKSHQEEFGFRYHMCMFTVNGGSVETVWNAITGNAATRATFVNNVENLLAANNMTGFNLDWERPDTVAEWGNYTQLAKDMQAAFPAEWEVSVDDYGFASSLWDDSPIFDANAYDQIGMMGYHYPANNGTSLDQQSFADGKKALTGQGAAKAFKDSQIIIGMGTWGDGGPATVSLKNIVAVDPNLPANATSWTGTVNDINGVSRTGTWDIVSRYEVRDNVQLALDRGMAGVMWWALNYDATNQFSLARVAQHYAMFKRGVPDLNLDGKVNTADAGALADNMGTVPGWKGTATAAQFENFYMSGNWEKGDRDGNGFVNQQDADWLAGRYATLGVALPDRLAYTGEFENFQNGAGLAGRWEAARNGLGQLSETGNYTQHDGGLPYSGLGPGGAKFSNKSVTIRNQNSAEAFDGLNMAPRQMRVELATPIDLGQEQETFVTFVVRQNTAPLSGSQFASLDRVLALELVDGAGQSQYDFAFFGKQTDWGIRSQADAAGQDATADGFGANVPYLFVGKIAGNGAEATTLAATMYPSGATVPNFSDPLTSWTLTAEGGAGVNPVITHLAFTSLFEGNFTVSNVWVGTESEFFGVPAGGDFDADALVTDADFTRWSDGFGAAGDATHWVGDADGDADADGWDFLTWQRRLGGNGVEPSAGAVPEPGGGWLAVSAGLASCWRRRR